MKGILKVIFSIAIILSVLNIDVKEGKQANAAVDVGICNLITANGGHNDKCGAGGVTFVNSSFEQPEISSTSYGQIDAGSIPGWDTTNSRNLIEVWSSPFAVSYTGTECLDGNQCVEINATEPASLYQDFAVKPGQYIYYSFYHMGRTRNTETLELRMGKPNDASDNKLNPTMGGVNDRVLESNAERGVWQHRFGFYQVPEDYASDGEYTLRIAFLATTDTSLGNLIDNIEFTTNPVYDNDVSISTPAGGTVDPATDIFKVSNTLKYFDRDLLSTKESSVTYTLSDNVEYVPNSLTIEGVSHSSVTYNGNEIVVTSLPEIKEDININYNIKLKGTPNIADIQISSYLKYASMLVVNHYPELFEYFDIRDNTNLNVSYNTEGYCDGITANNGFSEDCGEVTNTVYDNSIVITDNNPTSALSDKNFTITNDIVNLNTDTDLDESTATLVYDYSNNMNIDFSTLKINGTVHTDYTNNKGIGGAKLEIHNIPDVGIDDYKLTFDATYDFKAVTLRDVFTKQFLITSTLNYKNASSDSYVSDKDQMNLSYATTMDITGTLTDASSNSLLASGETINGNVTVTNSSPVSINNTVVNLISDLSKLENSLSNVVVKKGAATLTLNTDYTINEGKITFTKLDPNDVVTISYSLTAKDVFTNDKALSNTISVVGNEFKDGKYLLQKMNLDILASTKLEVTSSVTDNKNDFAGNNEELIYNIKVKNTGSFNVKSFEINDLINNSLLLENTAIISITDNSSSTVSTSNYTYTGDKLTVNKALAPSEEMNVSVKVKTVSLVSGDTLTNTFNVVGKAITDENLDVISSSASIPVSKRPVITVQDFVEINVGDTFNLTSYANANDAEDGNLTHKMVYTPAIDTSKPGIHQISVTVVDSDNRSISKNMVVLVNDGNAVYGDTKVIYAKDFERYVSQVATGDNDVKIAASMYVFNKADGKVTNEAVTIDKGGYKAQTGKYTITFTVNSEPTTKKSITATVKSTNPPVIKGTDFVNINVGETFDPRLNVTASDDFDGDLTSEIEINGSVDVNTAGIYKLKYSVTDSDFNTTTENRVILVNDGNYVAGDVYILYAEDFTRRVGEVQVSQDAVIIAANAKAYDKKTGERVTRKKVADLGTYAAVVGEYPISIYIADDTKAKRDITATVITGDIPVLTVPEFTQINVGGFFDPRKDISATDTEDIDLYSYINFTNPVDVNTPGIYVVDYDVTDNDANTVYAKQVVLVNDGSYNVGESRIIYAKDFYILTTEVDTSDAAVIAKANAKVYDKQTGQLSSDPLTVNNNGYSSTIGIYPIDFTVSTDATATKTINADVSNGHDPVINARKFAEVKKGSSFDVMFDVTATDIEDGDITSSINVTESIDTSVPGFYTVLYDVTDSTGNTGEATTIVLVNDGNYIVGNSEIIYAKNFFKLISDVDTSDSAIISDASAELYSKTTGEVLGTSGLNVDKGSYTNVKGQYNILFTSQTDSSAKRTVKATVSEGSPPILEVEEFIEIEVGNEFYPLNHAKATDAEEGNISALIEHNSNVNTAIAGFYKVDYEVRDSDGNTDTATSIVLVNDGTFGVGDFYVIQATTFTKRVSLVRTDIPTINNEAKVKIYDKATGELKYPDHVKNNQAKTLDFITNINDYKAVVGEYDIDFTLRLDPNATITITTYVVPGEAPVIDGEKLTEVELNATFDRTSTITALDYEDGDVSSIGRINGFVNTKVPGIYTLLYYVTDSDGNYTEFTRYVVVNDGTFIITDKRVIRARDFTLRVGQVDTDGDAVDDETDFAVFDIATETEMTLPYELNIGEYRDEVGEYDIDYLVFDEEEILKKTVLAEVIAGNAPVIETEQYVEIEVGEVFDRTADVVANDTEDGVVTHLLEISGEVDTLNYGVYPVTYTVTDSDKNTTTFVKVVVVGTEEHSVGDFVIVSALDFEKYVSEVAEPADRENQILTESDFKIYSKLTGENLTGSKFPVIETDYTNVADEYPIKLTVDLDPIIEHNIIGTVLAGDAPEYEGDSIIVLEVGSEFVLEDNIAANDTEDGVLTSKIEVQGSVDTSVVGVTPLTYTVTDKDNNTSTFTQIIVVGVEEHSIGESVIIYGVDFEKRVFEVADDKEAQIITESGFRLYDATTGEEIFGVIPNIDSGYTNVADIYPTTFTVGADPSVEHTIDAVVTLGNKPVIAGDDIVFIEINTPFVMEDLITAVDVEDGNIISKVIVDKEIDTSVNGVHAVTYTVTDSDNNTTEFTHIIIIDDGNYEVTDSYIIHKQDYEVHIDDVDTSDEAIYAASEFEVYTLDGERVSEENIAIDKNGYTNEVGKYNVVFLITNSYGEVTKSGIFVTVVGDEVVDPGNELNKTGFVSYGMYLSLILLGLILLRKKYVCK